MAVQVARSTGQTTARLAEWQIDSFLEGLTEPPEPGMTRTEVTYPIVELLLPELEEFLVYVWRRQLAASAGRVVQGADDEEMVDRRLAVAFADLVGFTRLTRRMEEEELGELVEAFETTAADLVAARGGRLIKTLGDEVLYVADDAGTAAEIAVRLIETMANDETMPELRVGMAFGTVTTRMGDVFGTTVNLASRLTSIAPRDAVLVDTAFAEEVIRTGDAPASEAAAAEAVAAAEKEGEEPPAYRFALQPMWQRPVRGLGVVEPWLLTRRNGTPGPPRTADAQADDRYAQAGVGGRLARPVRWWFRGRGRGCPGAGRVRWRRSGRVRCPGRRFRGRDGRRSGRGGGGRGTRRGGGRRCARGERGRVLAAQGGGGGGAGPGGGGRSARGGRCARRVVRGGGDRGGGRARARGGLRADVLAARSGDQADEAEGARGQGQAAGGQQDLVGAGLAVTAPDTRAGALR
ncbi:hypothetical protein SGRIM128S_08385 [Streptomyces griseomycini]